MYEKKKLNSDFKIKKQTALKSGEGVQRVKTRAVEMVINSYRNLVNIFKQSKV